MADHVNPSTATSNTHPGSDSAGAAPETNHVVNTQSTPMTMQQAAELLYPNQVQETAPKSNEAEPEAAGEADAATPEASKEATPNDLNPEAPKVEEPKAETPALTLPKDSTLEASDLEKFSTFAKEKNLSAEQAQSVLEQLSASRAEIVAKQKQEQDNLLKETKTNWEKSIRSDKQLGGGNFDKTMQVAKQGMTKYMDPDFIEYLNTTGLGNSPAMIKTFHRIGLAMQNDKSVSGPARAPSKKTAAEMMYPGMVQSK